MARRQRIGRGTGPTEEDLEEADLEGTTTVVGDYDYDTPTVDWARRWPSEELWAARKRA